MTYVFACHIQFSIFLIQGCKKLCLCVNEMAYYYLRETEKKNSPLYLLDFHMKCQYAMCTVTQRGCCCCITYLRNAALCTDKGISFFH